MKNLNKKLYIIIFLCILFIISLIFVIIYLLNITLDFKNSIVKQENISRTFVTSITEKQAIEIYERYRKEVILDNNDMYKFIEIKQEKMKVQNKYLLSSFPKEYIYYNELGNNYPIKEDTTEIDIYALYYKSDGDFDRMIGYVNMHTGEVIGNYREGV